MIIKNKILTLFFDIVTFAIYSNNNSTLVVGGIPEFFQFPKRDISTARCKRILYIFTYEVINVVLGTVKAFLNFIFTWSWIQFVLKEIVLVMRNCFKMFEIELVSVRRVEFRCSESLYSILPCDSNFQSISFE